MNLNPRKLLISAAPASAFVALSLFLGSAVFEKARGTQTSDINWAGITLASAWAGAATGASLMLQRVALSLEAFEQQAGLNAIAPTTSAPQDADSDDSDDPLLSGIFDAQATTISPGESSDGRPCGVVNFPTSATPLAPPVDELAPSPPPFNPSRSRAS